ncbi:UNVERIFIED_CONTAM: hypothetical protein O8I53_13520 [Campylobacter lari]
MEKDDQYKNKETRLPILLIIFINSLITAVITFLTLFLYMLFKENIAMSMNIATLAIYVFLLLLSISIIIMVKILLKKSKIELEELYKDEKEYRIDLIKNIEPLKELTFLQGIDKYLIQKVSPFIKINKYTDKNFMQLVTSFGKNENRNIKTLESVSQTTVLQSGFVENTPYVFQIVGKFKFESKTYTGEKTIKYKGTENY